MLGLPSTTEVGRRLPKEAFYRNLKLDARTHDEFVRLIKRITIANSIKPSTANVADGEAVHEIMVLEILLKGDEQPTRAIEAIATGNPHRLVFRTEPGGTTYLLRRGLHSADGLDALTLVGRALDATWDSICAQIIFDDEDGTDVDGRIERARRIAALEDEIAKLDAACHKAQQINRKNELFARLKAKKSELKLLESSENEKGE